MRAKAYDIVLNGYEVGGGSIRIHDSALQAKVFELLALSAEEAQDRFGFFLEALSYGTPPHGGIALGLDRMVMLMAGETSLRQVIAFPKTASGTDLMTGSPSPVRDEQVRELGLLGDAQVSARARAKLPGTEMTRVSVPERGLETLFGNQDENLRFLEETFKVRIRNHGSDLLIEGDERGAALAGAGVRAARGADEGRLRGGLGRRAAGGRAARAATARRGCATTCSSRPCAAASASWCRAASTSARTSRRSRRTTWSSGSVPPAPARPTWPSRRPSRYLLGKQVNRVILARPAVEAGEKLGFLPGDLQQKVDPYLRPLYDALYDLLEFEKVERLFERNQIEVAPIAFMRGRTLSDAFVIIDEAQNTTTEQMKMVLTRIGLGSKVVVTGDITQIDLPAGKVSGLVEAISVLSGTEGIAFSYFDEKDVVRHRLVQSIVKAYERWTNGQAQGALPHARARAALAVVLLNRQKARR